MRVWSSELVTYETGGLGHVSLKRILRILGMGSSSILGRSDESLQEILFFSLKYLINERN